MSKRRLRQPASGPRPARRSLVELTAAASRAAHHDLAMKPPGWVAAPLDDTSPVEQAAKTPGRMAAAGQATAAIRIATPEPANAAVSRSGEFQDSDSTTEVAVKIVKDYQTRVLDNMKVSMNAALDYAKDLANPRMPTDGTSKGRGVANPENNVLTALGAAADYRAEAFELMKANVDATLEYARELAGVRTPAEFVELSSTHARKQCELILKQTGALKSFARTVTKSGAA
jgi:hypothetical protein